jgi:glycosyltransferase involved in cell wall biosynthesis
MGGSERQLYLLIKHIDRTLFECHVVVFNPTHEFFKDPLDELGVRLWPVPHRCKGALNRMPFVYNVLRRVAPHIVHSWTFHDNPYAGVLGWFAGVPVRLGSLRNAYCSKDFQGLSPIARWLALHSVSRIVVNSESARVDMVRGGYPERRLALVPNCLDACFLERTTTSECLDLSSLGIEDSHRVVGIVGNLRSEKNHRMYLEVMASILSRFSDVRGLIVGQPAPCEPDLADRIKSAVRQLNLDKRVAIAGFRDDVPELMRRLTALCLTSDHEGTPNVVLEAMAASRPVVATRVGGVPELVQDGINGFLVEPGDVERFAQAVERLLSTPKRATQMGLAGRSMVEQEFGCAKTAQLFTDLYTSALGQKGIIVG